MLSNHPTDLLSLARERARDRREEAAAERLRRAAGTHRALAAFLRRLADRLDPAPLTARPA